MKCLQCGRKHNRKKFCSNRCKDRYHNENNPRGKFAHLAGVDRDHEAAMDSCELGWDAHKDVFQ